MPALGNPPLSLESLREQHLEDLIRKENSAARPEAGINTPTNTSSPNVVETPSISSPPSSIRPTTSVLSAFNITYLTKYGVSCNPTKSGFILIPHQFVGTRHAQASQRLVRIPEVFESVACLRWLGLKKRISGTIIHDFSRNGSNVSFTRFLDLVLEHIDSFDLPMSWTDLTNEQKLEAMKAMGLKKVVRQNILEVYLNPTGLNVKEVVSMAFRANWISLRQIEHNFQSHRDEIERTMQDVLPSVEAVPPNMQAVPPSAEFTDSDDSSSDAAAEPVVGNDTPEEATADIIQAQLQPAIVDPLGSRADAGADPGDDPMDITITNETSQGNVPLLGGPFSTALPELSSRSHVFESVASWLDGQGSIEEHPQNLLENTLQGMAEDISQVVVEQDSHPMAEEITPDTIYEIAPELAENPSLGMISQTLEDTAELSSQGTLEETPQDMVGQNSHDTIQETPQDSISQASPSMVEQALETYQLFPLEPPSAQAPPPPELMPTGHIIENCDSCGAELPGAKPCYCLACGRWNFKYCSRADVFTM